MAFLCSVKSRRGILPGITYKGAWTEQTVEIYSWLACGAGFIDVSLCQTRILKSKSMFCVIYRSSKRDQTYLYVEKKTIFRVFLRN